jgi:hypothetical protein
LISSKVWGDRNLIDQLIRTYCTVHDIQNHIDRMSKEERSLKYDQLITWKNLATKLCEHLENGQMPTNFDQTELDSFATNILGQTSHARFMSYASKRKEYETQFEVSWRSLYQSQFASTTRIPITNLLWRPDHGEIRTNYGDVCSSKEFIKLSKDFQNLFSELFSGGLLSPQNVRVWYQPSSNVKIDDLRSFRLDMFCYLLFLIRNIVKKHNKVAQRIFSITAHFNGGRLEIEHHLDEYVASKPFILLQEKFDHLSELLLVALPDKNLTLQVNICT